MKCTFFVLIMTASLGACVHMKPVLENCRINPDLVVHYSYEAEANQPFAEPYLAHFSKNGFDLYFVAAHHGTNADSKTFSLIRKVFTLFKPQSAIIEGYPNIEGESPSSFIEEVKRTSTAQNYKWGESAYTAEMAWKHKIPFIGAEPTDKEVFEEVKRSGYTLNDFLGFYFVRQIPQYHRQKEMANVITLFDSFMLEIHKELGLVRYTGFGFSDFLKWYSEKNGEKFDLKKIDPETSAPLKDGKLFTQRISHVVGLARDRFIVEVISKELNKHHKVLIVIGKSHLAQQQYAIETAMGRAIYQGTL